MNSTISTSSGSGAEFDYLFKLLIIGNSGVGKSCMLLRYSVSSAALKNLFLKENSFTTNFFNTIGVDFKIKSIILDGKNIKLQIWDTAGQDRFRTITCSYYRGAQGILIVYDVTDRESFDNIKTWMNEIDKYAQENVLRVLVGNKSDMNEKRKVTYEEGQELAKQYGIMFFETSAKNSHNIDMAFQAITRLIMEKTITAPQKSDLSKLDNKKKIGFGSSTNTNSSSSCC